MEGDVITGKAVPFYFTTCAMACVCHLRMTQYVSMQMSFMVCYYF